MISINIDGRYTTRKLKVFMLKKLSYVITSLALVSLVGCATYSQNWENSSQVERMGRDLVGSEISEWFTVCPGLSIDQITDVMQLIHDNPNESAVNTILNGNNCQMVEATPDNHKSYKITQFHAMMIDKKEPSDEYPTSYWFSFFIDDGAGVIQPAFVGIDTD